MFMVSEYVFSEVKKFYICHIYIFQLQIVQQNVDFSQSYCTPIPLSSVFGACARSERSL